MSRDPFHDLQRQETAGPQHIRLLSEGGSSLARSPRPVCIDSIQMTHTCTTESQHMVYRAAEGAESVFPPPDNPLFSISPVHAGELDSGSIPGALRAAFQAEKLPLSDSICLIVQHPGRWWLLTDNGKRYSIRKLASHLTVFQDL